SCHALYLSLFFTDPPPTEIYTLSLHDALPISYSPTMSGYQIEADLALLPTRRLCALLTFVQARVVSRPIPGHKQILEFGVIYCRSEEHTSELQSRENLVCRLLLEKKKK